MNNTITVRCPTCGHEWWQDLSQAQTQRVIYRGDQKQTRVEVYVFTCPQDGTKVAVEVEREA
ncbi:MAG: hypothetical protein H6631_05995 [Anaerolineaceae bacterium]|nr:hypothetical protein [Anaerolineaceae bacterium]MCB9101348.1 hypothetical protein [Anaerolineales bacterium]